MKILAVMLIAIISIPIIFIITTEYDSNTFNNYTELEASGLIRRGWVPEYIPKSSYNIKEHHRVDAPYIYVEFNFIENDLETIKNNCNLIEKNIYKCKDGAGFLKLEIKAKNFVTIQRF